MKAQYFSPYLCPFGVFNSAFCKFLTMKFISFFFVAALFLEFWKQYSREITHRWDVTGFTPEEEHPRPEYLEKLKNVEEKTMNFVTQTMEPKVFLHQTSFETDLRMKLIGFV